MAAGATSRMPLRHGWAGTAQSHLVGREQGIAQLLDIHVRDPIADGRLVQLLPQWADETYPLFAYHHSAQLMSAKVRAFIDFVVDITRIPDADVRRTPR